MRKMQRHSTLEMRHQTKMEEVSFTRPKLLNREQSIRLGNWLRWLGQDGWGKYPAVVIGWLALYPLVSSFGFSGPSIPIPIRKPIVGPVSLSENDINKEF